MFYNFFYFTLIFIFSLVSSWVGNRNCFHRRSIFESIFQQHLVKYITTRAKLCRISGCLDSFTPNDDSSVRPFSEFDHSVLTLANFRNFKRQPHDYYFKCLKWNRFEISTSAQQGVSEWVKSVLHHLNLVVFKQARLNPAETRRRIKK